MSQSPLPADDSPRTMSSHWETFIMWEPWVNTWQTEPHALLLVNQAGVPMRRRHVRWSQQWWPMGSSSLTSPFSFNLANDLRITVSGSTFRMQANKDLNMQPALVKTLTRNAHLSHDPAGSASWNMASDMRKTINKQEMLLILTSKGWH